jgi:hypothetical protein
MRALAFSVIVALAAQVACGGSQPASTLSSAWKAPAILSHVPADSPYVFASLEAVSEALRTRLTRGMDARIAELVAKLEQLRGNTGEFAPLIRAGLAVRDELRGVPAANWSRALGFDPAGQFALYGLSLWPVLRMSIADPVRLRQVIEHVTTAAGAVLAPASFEGRAYWSVTTHDLTVIAAVLDREAVVALLPTSAVAAQLPYVLGTQRPAANLATATLIPDLLGRHRLLGYLAAYVDTHRIVDILTGTGAGPLDASLHAAVGPISPVCRADLLRLSDVVPRVVFGYRKVDDAGFDGLMAAEVPASVLGPLAKLHTAASGVTATSTSHALFSLGVAARPDDVVGWLGGVGKALHDHPFACPDLLALNEAGRELEHAVASGLPPPMRGLRGFALVLDSMQVAMRPVIDGHLIVTGDFAQDFLSTLSAAVPALAGVPVKRDGHAVPLPLSQLGLPLEGGHIAMTSDRLAISAGAASSQRAEAQVAAPLPARSPLMMMTLDAPALKRLLASLGRPPVSGLDTFTTFTMVLDATEDGIVLDVAGTWAVDPAAPGPR